MQFSCGWPWATLLSGWNMVTGRGFSVGARWLSIDGQGERIAGVLASIEILMPDIWMRLAWP